MARLRPDHRLAQLNLADALFKQGDYDGARAGYERASLSIIGGRIDAPPPPGPRSVGVPAIEHARLGLARVALVRGDRPAALKILGDIFNRRRDFGPAMKLFAQVLEESGRLEDARSVREAATGSAPYVPPPDPEIDDLLRESCNSDLLIRNLRYQTREENWQWVEFLARRAVHVNPDDLEAEIAYADMLWLIRNFGEAIPVLERLEPRVPDRAGIVVRIVEGYMRMNRPEDAEAWCRKRLAKTPDDALIRGLLAGVYRRTQRFAEAEHEYNASLALADDPDFRTFRGACRGAQGRFAEAIADFKDVLARYPEHAEALRHLVQSHMELEDYAGVKEWAERLVALEPLNPRGHYALARAAHAAGDGDTARERCREALRLAPTFEEARQFLARIMK